MTPTDALRLTAKAAALLIGENPRTVQGWFTRAGHAASRSRDGYPLPIVAEVLADNDRAVPPDVLHREASVTPQRRRRPRRGTTQLSPLLTANTTLARHDNSASLEHALHDARIALGALEREQELSASLASSLAALTQEIAALRAGMREMQEQVAAVTARQRRWWQRK